MSLSLQEHAPAAELRAEDFERVEDYLRAYLGDERFRSAYLRAFERWSDAASTLYGADSRDSVLVAGERARQTIEEFADAFAGSHVFRGFAGSHDVRGGNAHFPGRRHDALSAVIESCRPRVGDARCEFLQSLFDYWRVLNHVVERQRDRAQETGEPLRWEDARRVVVLTALVMVEIDRSL
jgi:hypothetical protein